MAEPPLSASTSSSPPGSPPRMPRKPKKKSDPFLELPDIPIGDGSSDQGSNLQEMGTAKGQDESTLTKIIMTPLVFTSFIFSLLLVNHRYRAWRLSEHPPTNSTFWSRIALRSWLDPEPYQSPSDTTWQHSTDNKGHVPHPQRERWFTHKKHRKVARMEISDAFDMSGRVMVLVGSVLIVGVLGVGWAANQALRAAVW
ncbi:hypothetical protein EG328_008457 [Venturia inaequalis]|uniref:Uncharacterized protein n=2 Tax=Venturia inaequalis TaxID=5025 RepID=A0A8H3Z667_VENIN|nr:hypothetical protein EG328_008457 [Venturia inaequalis]